MQIKTLKTLYKIHKEKALFGRYIHTKNIKPLLENLPSIFKIEVIGKSVNNENIFSITIGSGKKKVLMWSQMHGNESTTTKALFDLFNILGDSNEFSDTILNNCTLNIIPILNPDGAASYTRFNTNSVDLNRDAQDLTQPESIILKKSFNKFQPDFCFNLHGQRTIFSAGKTDNPATVSFLSPSQDETRSLTMSRKIAMEIIGEMNSALQQQIPNQVGIYDDAFNVNCVGDTFQSLNVPTILFEAGHYKNDYGREQTREFIFQSLLTALNYISNNKVDGSNYKSYLNIPKNEDGYFDIIIRNARVLFEGEEQCVDIGVLYEERLVNGIIEFIPIIEKISDLGKYCDHKVINANNHKVLSLDLKELNEGYEIDCVLINNKQFLLKIEKS